MANRNTEFVDLKTGGKFPFKVADLQLRRDQVLTDNEMILKKGVKITRTPEQELEWMKCAVDPIYFIETYIRIISLDEGLVPFKLYDFQKEMILAYAQNRYVICCTARQMGKTTTVAAFIMWYMIFNKNKKCAVLANLAEQALEIMERIRLMYVELPFFLQKPVDKFNDGSIVLDDGSKVFSGSSNPDTVRGKSLNLVYWDESAFTARDEEFWASTFPVLSSGKTTKIFLTSTPKGARGVFHRTWKGAYEEGSKWNDFRPIAVPWHKHPNRDEAWKESTIAKTSPSQFSQEHDLKFLGSSGTLIPNNILELLQFNNPLNNDEYLHIYNYPQKGHKYVAIADPAGGVGEDSSVCTIIDVSVIPYSVSAVYRNNTISPLLFPYQLVSMCETYGQCPLLIESNNDVGGQVAYICYYELEYPEVILTSPDTKGLMGERVGGKTPKPGVKTTKRVKMIGCSNLKTLLENNLLEITNSVMIEELGTFIAKGNSYEADDGCHDDTVMTLVLFAWLMKQPWFIELTETNVQNSLHDSNIRQLEDELLSIYYVNGADSPQSFAEWMKS